MKHDLRKTPVWGGLIVVYYESINRDLKRRLIYEYRCDERLKTKTEESTRLACTALPQDWIYVYYESLK